MDVLFLSPAYPPEMQQFTRGLHAVGARVWGVGDGAEGAAPRGGPVAARGVPAGPAHPGESRCPRAGGPVPRSAQARRRGGPVGGGAPPRGPDPEADGNPGMSTDTVAGFRDKVL